MRAVNSSGGRLVFLIGPSGAGKDTVLRWLERIRPRPAQLHIARRSITRLAVDRTESHEPLTEAQFQTLVRANAFALHWCAHGLLYGIRREELAPLSTGANVIINGSRAYVACARERYPGLFVVRLSAAPEVLRSRLLLRGRENPQMIASRMIRNAELATMAVDAEVRNDTSPQQAARQLLALLGLSG